MRGERSLERRRHRLGVPDDLSEHVELLVLTTRGLPQAERDDGDHDDRHGQDVKGPAPSVGPPDHGGDSADQDRAEGGGDAGGDAHPRPDAAAHADRVGVGQEGPVHALRGRLGHPGPETSQEEQEDVRRQPREEHHDAEEERGAGDDRGAAVAVGHPAHGQDAEHQERARDAGHEHDDAGAHSERRLDVGREDAQTGALEVVQGHDESQDHERRGARLSQALAEGRPLLARPRQEVLGKEHLFLGLGRAETLLGGVGEEASQIGGALASLRGAIRCRRRDVAHRRADPSRPRPRCGTPHACIERMLGRLLLTGMCPTVTGMCPPRLRTAGRAKGRHGPHWLVPVPTMTRCRPRWPTFASGGPRPASSGSPRRKSGTADRLLQSFAATC